MSVVAEWVFPIVNFPDDNRDYVYVGADTLMEKTKFLRLLQLLDSVITDDNHYLAVDEIVRN